MFDDKFGLTKAVLEGRKTMTRRIIKTPRTMEGKDVYGFSVVKYPRTGVPIEVMALDADGAQINNILPKYKVGEVVAVAQSYEAIRNERYKDYCNDIYNPFGAKEPDLESEPGWTNKMFVSANLMPHQIRITNIRIERLQDISDEDCLNEGVFLGQFHTYSYVGRPRCPFNNPRDAFASLIDRISGKGTWKSNPWVFVYEFELVK